MSLKINSALARIPKPQLPEKLKGTIVERWINYWKGLGRDYKEVSIDTLKFIKANPVKSSIYGGIASFAVGCYKSNPTYQTYTDQLKKAQNLIALVYDESRNPVSVNYMKNIEKYRNKDELRVTSLGLFSILWVADYASELATPDATCNYLKPAVATFHERIIDYGFFGRWWNIEKSMDDYDVNF